MKCEDAERLIKAAYMAEVESRHTTFVDDNYTKKNIHGLALHLTTKQPKFGILLCGNCGNGKTTMINAFKNAIIYLDNHNYFSTYFKNMDITMRIYDAREIVHIAKTNYTLFEKVKGYDMIGLEDIGREPTEVLDYGNVLNPIVDLLENRYSLQKFTFVTTNLTPKQIREKYGNRIADRFNEMMSCIVFENPTYRKQ